MINPSISIIIPVYNAALYVEKAIFSALQQPEVLEVLVVNDGSTDGSDEILQSIASTTTRVTLLFHPQRINKGRSASRNLGLQHARGTYIAFLDADDYYLENRFSGDLPIFESQLDCDGVYNAIGVHFYRDATLEQQQELALYTITERIKPQDLFENLLLGGKGHFSIDGLTLKRSLIDKVGFFNTHLVVGEDTDYMWRMALVANLYAGSIENPVAIRGVHDANVFDKPFLYQENKLRILDSVLRWSANHGVRTTRLDLILKHIWILKQKQENPLMQDIWYWFNLFLPQHKLMFSSLNIKYFPIIRYRQKLFSFLYRK
ncbi:glycosyltransferase [Flavobacterium sp. CHNK8]|uniref:glycosyltransferase family 2 protein n=1 Tax=Flavobacterium sp. CHNK8 TaxID=2871165 RepID=UPI001C8E965C|nr:glycosyltransferase family 2 protein [Flavobacterium sp. CHNK8]QZK89621.1 glycosyltransferase [Flavobacterium sp. CHNK8]